jgi:hypothetical protein
MPRVQHYTDRDRFDAYAGPAYVLNLLDFGRDEGDDSATFTAYRDKAENLIDRTLRQKYVVPFDDIESGDLDESVSDLADEALLLLLVEHHRPGGEETKERRKLFRDHVTRILNGDEELDAAKVDAARGREFVSVASTSPDPVFAGTDDDGDDRMSGW